MLCSIEERFCWKGSMELIIETKYYLKHAINEYIMVDGMFYCKKSFLNYASSSK